jgi:hypothetical protein
MKMAAAGKASDAADMITSMDKNVIARARGGR